MRYAVIGGDMRFAHLAAMLAETGRQAAGFFQPDGEDKPEELRKYDCFISNWPMKPGKAAEEVFHNIRPGSVLLLCGPGFPGEKRWDLQYVNLWEDEELLTENAYLTAEGAVASAMSRTAYGLQGEKCLVVGYGRIGRALADILTGIGAHTAVYSHSAQKYAQIRTAGAEVCTDLSEALKGRRFIFSTPPAQLIGPELLDVIDRDALIIDLASPPYGVDMDAALERGLHAIREPGLPGRYCPVSAARAILNAVLRWEADNND